MLPITFLLLARLLVTAPTLAAGAPELPASADVHAELRAFVEIHQGAPGVVVGLIDQNSRRVMSYGSSGRSELPALDGNTRFEIGSITKTFTGALLADRVLAGEVMLDQKVASLLPQGYAPSNGAGEASLLSLATHTSGLPRLALDPASLSRLLSVDPYKGLTAEDVFRSVAALPTSVSPTESPEYSNLGFALLGRLLEEQAGVSYEALLRERILEPMGLATIATSHGERSSPALARGHGPGGRPASYWHVDGYGPAGCLIASTNELLDYLDLHLKASHPALVEAQRRHKSFEDGRGIGLGWMHSEVEGRRLIWHNGGTGGFRSFAGFFPDEGRALVILANGQGDVDALARRLLDPKQPPLVPRATGPTAYGLTFALLLWGPLLLFQWKRRASSQEPGKVTVDRLDILRSPLSPWIAMTLAARLGAWQALPFVLWWAACLICVGFFILLVHQWGDLLSYRQGLWTQLGRVMSTVLEIFVLVLLYR